MSSKVIFAAVAPIKKDLETIKGQLNQISTTLDDLTERVAEMERLLKEAKQKVKVA